MINEIEHAILGTAEFAALAIEMLAVIIIVAAVFIGLVNYLRHPATSRGTLKERFLAYRRVLARALLLGLELLVAADIVKTVVLEPTLQNVAVLGLLVLIRIFLGWSLIVELEGRWPWQGKSDEE